MVPMHKLQAMVADQPRGAPRAAPLWNELVDPDVRALAALIASPLLIAEHAAPIATLTDAWRIESLRLRHGWLLDLDAAPQRLREHLAASNARQLGRYAEALWRFWFAHLPGARLHAAGLPVKDALAVRGEFDFIVSLPGLSEVQHLEMAYKFYLYCPPGDDFSRLFGPNAADRLDRKWQHMLDVQLPLSQTALGRAALPAGSRPGDTAGVSSGLVVLSAGDRVGGADCRRVAGALARLVVPKRRLAQPRHALDGACRGVDLAAATRVDRPGRDR